MRRDLGAQRPQLGPGEQLALRLQRRERDLRADEAGRLLHHPHVLGADPARAGVERVQAADEAVLDRDRHHDRRAQRAVGVAAVELRLDVHPIGAAAGMERRDGVARRVPAIALTDEREHAVRVGERDRRGLGELEQVRRRPGRALGGEAATQMRERRRGGVESGLHGLPLG